MIGPPFLGPVGAQLITNYEGFTYYTPSMQMVTLCETGVSREHTQRISVPGLTNFSLRVPVRV